MKIHVDTLNFYYGAKRALTDISIDMRANEVTAFIGPSGCGKSTFLRTLNRMNDIVPGARVNGTVQNMVEFEKAFSCKAGAPMAPVKRCRVW